MRTVRHCLEGQDSVTDVDLVSFLRYVTYSEFLGVSEVSYQSNEIYNYLWKGSMELLIE